MIKGLSFKTTPTIILVLFVKSILLAAGSRDFLAGKLITSVMQE